MKNFIKQNLSLCIGIALPVFMILLFIAARAVPMAMATPPQYDLLLAVQNYADATRIKGQQQSLRTENGKIVAATEKTDSLMRNATIDLYRYSPADGKLQKIAYTPAALGVKQKIVPETKNLVIEASDTAPDGYRYETGNYSSGFFFFGHYNDNKPRLVKNGAVFQLPTDVKIKNHNTQFLGWIVETK